MAITYSAIFAYIFTNLDNNKITVNGIKQLMPMQIPKLQLLYLSNFIVLVIGWNKIGSIGAKWLTKINMPLI